MVLATTRREWATLCGAGWRRGLDLLLPPHCLRCGDIVAEPGRVCAPCWQSLRFISEPACTCCGLPFPFDPGFAALCAACLAAAPPYRRARAVLAYDDGSRPLILSLKHGDHPEIGRAVAPWLARAAGPLLADADWIVPVPLHRWRLWRRRYNQAGLMAQALARQAGRPVLIDALLRVRPTASQGRQSPAARRRNLRRAIAVNPRRRTDLTGRRVLLVDDVMTTGATVEACARALRGARIGALDVITLARVLRNAQPSPAAIGDAAL